LVGQGGASVDVAAIFAQTQHGRKKFLHSPEGRVCGTCPQMAD